MLKLDSFQEIRIKRPIRPQGLNAEQEKKQRSRLNRTLTRDILPLGIDDLETIEDINSALRAIDSCPEKYTARWAVSKLLIRRSRSAGSALKSNLRCAPRE